MKEKITWTLLVALVLVASIAVVGHFKWEGQERVEYQKYLDYKEKDLDKFWDCVNNQDEDPYEGLDFHTVIWMNGGGFVCGKCVYTSPVEYNAWKYSRPSFWNAMKNE